MEETKNFIEERNNITINPIHNRIPLSKTCNLKDFNNGFKMGCSFWENGEFLRKSGDFEEAIRLFDQARYYGYLVPALYTSYAMVYRKLEDYDNEIDILDEALKVCKNEIAFEKFEIRRHKAICLFIKQKETVIDKLPIKKAEKTNACNVISIKKFVEERKMVYDENGNIKGRNLINHKLPSDFVLFDLETTGFDAGNKIVEIAAVKVRGDKIIDCFEKLVNPQTSISKRATKEHGITNEMVNDKPLLDNIIGNFVEFIDKDILIGHHINGYDYNILLKECYRLLGININNDFIDTLTLAQRLIDEDVVENYKLTTLCDYFNIKEKPNHRALQDVKANYELYKILKSLPDKRITKSKSSKNSSTSSDDYIIYNFDCTIDVKDKTICLSGDFDGFTQKQVEQFLINKGAIMEDGNKLRKSSTDILLIGDKGSDDWKYGNYGNKVKQAMTWNEKGASIKIIKQKEFFKEMEVV